MTTHASAIETNEDGWIIPRCTCGWDAGGVVPDQETAADCLMDHVAQAVRAELAPDERPRAPRRRFSIYLDAHSDTLDGLDRIFSEMDEVLADETVDHWERTSGGVDTGYTFKVTRDPDMTPERYQAELDAWVAVVHS